MANSYHYSTDNTKLFLRRNLESDTLLKYTCRNMLHKIRQLILKKQPRCHMGEWPWYRNNLSLYTIQGWNSSVPSCTDMIWLSQTVVMEI